MRQRALDAAHGRGAPAGPHFPPAIQPRHAAGSDGSGRRNLGGGSRNDHHVQARRHDFLGHRIRLRDALVAHARTGIPEQGRAAEHHRPAQPQRAGRVRARLVLFDRGAQGVRPVPRREPRAADRNADLHRHRERRRTGRSGDAIQHELLGERPLVCQQHQYDRGRHAPDGLPPRADAHAEEIRRGLGPARQAEVRDQRRRLPRGTDGHRIGQGGRAPVRGTDQDEAGQQRGGRSRRSGHIGRADALSGGEPEGRPSDRIESDPRRHGTPRGAQGPRAGAAQDRTVGLGPAGQAGRLLVARPRSGRNLLRRGRLGRRIGQAGPRQEFSGDHAAAGQDIERRESHGAPDFRERGNPQHLHRTRRDHRHRRRQQGAESGEAALRAGHHHDRCRCRRQPHRHTDADVLLPLHEQPDQERTRLYRDASSLSGQERQEQPLLLDRGGTRGRARGVRSQGRSRTAVQRSGRDESRTAVGNDHVT